MAIELTFLEQDRQSAAQVAGLLADFLGRTTTSLHDDAFTLQENNIVRIDSPELAVYFETDFDELWTRGDIGTSGAHDTGTVQVSGVAVGVAFARGEGRAIDLDIAHHIRAARRRLQVGSMLLTSGGILGALGDVLEHGRVSEYGGIYDRTQMESVFDQWRGTPAARKLPGFQRREARSVGQRVS